MFLGAAYSLRCTKKGPGGKCRSGKGPPGVFQFLAIKMPLHVLHCAYPSHRSRITQYWRCAFTT